MEQGGTRHLGVVQRRTFLQLGLSHLCVSLLVLIFHSSPIIILPAVLLGLILTGNIPYSLHTLEFALSRLTRDLHIEPLPYRRHWPLTRLFTLVNQLSQQHGSPTQLQRQTASYRDQVGKTAAQEERNRLARDLHDSIKQQIFSIAVSIAAIKVRWEQNPASIRPILDDIEHTTHEAQVEMQALLQELRPQALENVGLLEALRLQCQALEYRTGATVLVELRELPDNAYLPLGTQETLFRIVQEGFANIARHARASSVWLSLHCPGHVLRMEIGDDGQGFLPGEQETKNGYRSMGLSNVRERVEALNGVVEIWSLPGQGTTLHLEIPLVRPGKLTDEENDADVELATQKARSTLRVGRWCAFSGAAWIIFMFPLEIRLFLLSLSGGIALLCWLWSRQYTMQLPLSINSTHRSYQTVRQESTNLLALLLGLSILYCGDLALLIRSTLEIRYPDFIPQQGPYLYWSGTALCSLAFLVVLIMQIIQNEQLYRSLPPPLVSEQLGNQLQSIVLHLLSCLLASVWTLLVMHASLTFSVSNETQWLADSALLFLFGWGLITFIAGAQVMRWQWLRRRKRSSGENI